MKILIADDETEVVDSLRGILHKGAGFDTDYAQDGEETLHKIKNDFYDALLLDIVMPKLDGYAVLQQVRKIFPTMPVIFITGHGEAKKIEESIRQYNLNGVIEKPFSPKEVLDIINKAVKVKRVEE